MADILLDEQGFPAAPAAGQMVVYADSGNSVWTQRNDAGLHQGDVSGSTVAQIAAHSVDTYYRGLQLPSFSMQAGMVIMWEFVATKGAAGTAAPIYTIRIGPNQTTADTARLAITGPAQTAAADVGFFKVMATVRTVAAGGVVQGLVHVQHNLAATGFANTPAGFSLAEGTSAGFDNTALQGLFIGLSVNPGSAGAWVVNQVFARMWY